ncbi:MAG: type 4a pilus biogenesis protein PilO [Phycisphaerales bacterium]|nr:MAG: type 4a pilus biogenesis protein PilO [Phycisphaerales bacterium]
MLFRERQQVTISIAAIAVMGCFVLLRYLPLKKEIQTVNRTKAAQMLVITGGEECERKIPALKEQLDKLSLAVGNYESCIPQERALGPFLHRIADLMNEHKLTEQSVTPGEEVAAGELCCIPVTMQCKGTLARVFEFYRHLRGLDRIVRIEQVKLTNDAEFSGRVRMETRAVIYYRAGAPGR